MEIPQQGNSAVTKQQITKLNGIISILANQKLSSDIGFRYQDLPFKLELALASKNDEIEISSSRLVAFSGVTNLTGFATTIANKPFAFAIKAQGLDLAAISKIALEGKPFSLTGSLDSLTTEVKANGADIKTSLDLNTQASAINGTIKGVNIFAQTLGAIKSIPGVSGSMDAFIPDKYKTLISASDTAFSQLNVEMSCKNQNVNAHRFELVHSAYAITGKGTASFDGDLNLSAQLRLTPALTTDMITKQPNLALLQDSNNNIVIPIVIKREGGIIIVLPDISDFAERAAKNAAKGAASKALDKVAPGLSGAAKSLGGLFK